MGAASLPDHMAKEKICVFCGEKKRCTKDHIPPKNLFNPAPANLITVPACSQCNTGTSQDDEYFRIYITAREDIERDPLVKAPKEALIRNLQNPASSAFAKALNANLKIAERHTPSGILVDHKQVLVFDDVRIFGSIRKYIRGLYANQFGELLPKDSGIEVLLPEGRYDCDTGEERDLYREFDEVFSKVKAQDKGGQFSYKFFKVETGETLWQLEFFSKIRIFATTSLKSV